VPVIEPHHRNSPRISATKLGEYTDASPLRRRTIVRNQREPSDFIVARYEKARTALTDYFIGGANDVTPVAESALELSTLRGATDWQTQDFNVSGEALERFLDISDDFELDGLECSPGSNSAPKLVIADVDVSVRPDVILRGTLRNKRIVGALKFYFGKTTPLGDEAGLNVATLLQRYCDEHLIQSGEVTSPKHCAVLDVFAKRWFRSTRATQMRFRGLEAACEEIRLWWNAA